MIAHSNRGKALGYKSLYLKLALVVVTALYFLVLVPTKVAQLRSSNGGEGEESDAEINYAASWKSPKKGGSSSYRWSVMEAMDQNLDILLAKDMQEGGALKQRKEAEEQVTAPVTLWSTDFHIAPIADLKVSMYVSVCMHVCLCMCMSLNSTSHPSLILR